MHPDDSTDGSVVEPQLDQNTPPADNTQSVVVPVMGVSLTGNPPSDGQQQKPL